MLLKTKMFRVLKKGHKPETFVFYLKHLNASDV